MSTHYTILDSNEKPVGSVFATRVALFQTTTTNFLEAFMGFDNDSLRLVRL